MNRVRPALALGGALTTAALLAACGSPASSPVASSSATSPATSSAPASMATSLATPDETWAVLPMAANPAFWQVFVRSGSSATWKLVTPPGVADNGGLVVSADGESSLSVAVRPSQGLLFSPLAVTANGGASWSPGPPLEAAVAASPDAFADVGADLVALLTDGAIETSADAGTTWSVLAKPGAIAASPAASGCDGAVRVTSVSFGTSGSQVLAGGSCGTSGTTALFDYSPGTGWQREPLPVSGQLLRLSGSTALVDGKAGLTALSDGFSWYAYSPKPRATAADWEASGALPVSGPLTASGELPLGGAWVLLPGGRAATVSGPGQQWLLLPPVPAKTAVLAAGPDGATDALAVSGETLTVWQLPKLSTVWSKVQTINVPIQYGSSS